MSLRLDHDAHDGIHVLAVSGELDLSSAPDVRTALALAASGPGGHLILDLSDVTFIDSTALMRLLTALRDLNRRGGRMVLACSNPTVLRLFEVTRTNETFEIFPTRDQALGRFEVA
jgi:anti-sigma B factor antagonist